MQSLVVLLERIDCHLVKGRTVSGLIEDRCGVTALEYGLIAALIAVAAVVIMTTVGTNLSDTFSTVANSL